MSFFQNIDHNDFFNNFKDYCGGISDSDSTRLSIHPPNYPIIRNMKNMLNLDLNRATNQNKEEYYSKKENFKFIEMMENTFSSDIPTSTRNRTPFLNITESENNQSKKPRLPKAPKNFKLNSNRNFGNQARNEEIELKSKEKNFFGAYNTVDDSDYENKLQRRKNRRRHKSKSCIGENSLDFKMKTNDFLDLEASKMNYSTDDYESHYNNMKEFGTQISPYYRKKLKAQNEKANQQMVLQRLPKKSDSDRDHSSRRVKHRQQSMMNPASFQEFMKINKSKNSLLSSLKRKIVMGNKLKMMNKSKNQHRRRHSNMIPPIPIDDVSKVRLREQIQNSRLGGESQLICSHSSKDELKTLKRRTGEQRFDEFEIPEMTTNRNSTSRLNTMKLMELGQMKSTKDMSIVCSSSLKKLKQRINSSEFLRSQMVRAKVMEGSNTELYREYENCTRLNKYQKMKNFHIDFGKMGMDINSIYSQKYQIATKKKLHEDSERDIVNRNDGQPRISRHKKSKQKKIMFPKYFGKYKKC